MSPLPLLLILLLAAGAASQASAAVASIDVGSESLKVAVVDLKPGRPPISIAINEMSKRKSPALAAIAGGDRYAGEEAATLAARSPEKTFPFPLHYLSKTVEYARGFADSLYLPHNLAADARGAASVVADDGTMYTFEEILGMVLNYGIGLATAHVGSTVKDAVISVPAYMGQSERRAVMQAAKLVGINVLGLVNQHAGAALQYGIDKDFSNGSRHVVFYDMGATGTSAALVYYSAYNAKELGKTVSVNQFLVKDVRWNSRLGGLDLEMRLVDYFGDEFNKQLGDGTDVRKYPKAMAKLKKQVKRTKEILSANTAAPISVESLYNDIDFRSTITREKFEQLCEDLWEKALTPLKEVISHSGLKINDIYAVELIGGATRVPKLQAKLQDFLGRNDLDKHLDADEAIALGASLHAANLSDGIKLNRKLGMIDGSSYGLLFDIDRPELLKDQGVDQILVPRMKKMPIKMFRSIKHSKDFEVSLSYDKTSELPLGVSSNVFAEYSVTGLTDASEKYSTRNLSAPIKANIHFSLSRSGVLSFERAEAVVEISEWVEVPKKNLTVESNVTANAANSSDVSGIASNTVDTKEGSDLSVASDGLNSTVDKTNDDVIVTEKVLKKRTFRIPLKVVEKTSGPGSVLSDSLYSEAKLRLETLDKKDAERRRTAELKNNLESYIYSTKEKLEGDAEIEKVSTEQERQSFMEKLNEVQDWLYMDGEDAQANEFEAHINQLKKIGDPIFLRLSELTARPAACEHARVYLDELQKIVNNWETNKPWLPKERIDEVLRESGKLNAWLEEKEALQKKTPDSSTPVFKSEEVYERVLNVQDKVSSVNRIPKPKPKVEKTPKEEASTEELKSSTPDDKSQADASHEPTDSSDSADTKSEHDEL